jgi:IclR family transcriptional regulator, acetate operon repressor
MTVTTGAMRRKTGGSQNVQSVERASSVLDLIFDSRSALSALEISRLSGLERTIVHRLLRTLVSLDFVRKVESGKYDLGPRLLRLGNAYLDRIPVRPLALPYAVDISNSIGDRPWIVSIAVPVEGYSVIIDRLWSKSAPLDGVLDLGSRVPLASSATGLSILARYDEETAKLLCGPEQFARIQTHLAEIQERGFLEFNSGFRPGMSSIAASIGGRHGAPAGALSVLGLDLDGELDVNSEIAQRMARAAQALTAVLSVG